MTYVKHTFSLTMLGVDHWYVSATCDIPKKYLKVCIWNKFYIPEKYPKHTTWDLYKTYLTSTSKMYDFGMNDILKTHQWHIKNKSDMTYLKHSCSIWETYVCHTKNILQTYQKSTLKLLIIKHTQDNYRYLLLNYLYVLAWVCYDIRHCTIQWHLLGTTE